MFLLNVGYKWNWASTLDELRGVVYLASGNDAQRMSRKSIPEYNRSMFDPQLYLSNLDAAVKFVRDLQVFLGSASLMCQSLIAVCRDAVSGRHECASMLLRIGRILCPLKISPFTTRVLIA